MAAPEEAREGKIPYDRGWSWMVVLGICMMHVFLIGYIKTFGLLFVELQDLFNLTSQQTAWVSTAMLLSIDILSPVGTALGDRFGSRVIVMTGGFVVCLSLVLSSFLYDIRYIVAIMGAMFGAGATLCYAPSMIMVGYYFKRRLGLANALAVSGSSLGQFILPPIVTVLLEKYSLNGTLLILAGIMFNLTLSGALLRPVSYYGPDHCEASFSDEESSTGPSSRSASTEKQLLNKEEPDENLLEKMEIQKLEESHVSADLSSGNMMSNDTLRLPVGNERNVKDRFVETLPYAGSMDLHCSMNVPTSKVIITKYRQRSTCVTFLWSIFDIRLLKNPVYAIFALGCTCVNFSYIGTFRYLPAHCKDMGIGEHERAMLLSLVGITDLFSRLFVGLIADTVVIRERFKRYRLLSFSLLALGANGLFLVYSRTVWQITLSCSLYGIFGGIYMTLLSVSLVDLLGAENLSRAWGIMLLLYGATTVGEPLILGNLRDMTGSYDASFLTCGGLFFAGGLLILMAPKTSGCVQRWAPEGKRH